MEKVIRKGINLERLILNKKESWLTLPFLISWAKGTALQLLFYIMGKYTTMFIIFSIFEIESVFKFNFG